MPKLSVFVVEGDSANAELTQLVESLREDATGYSPGLEVTPDATISGLYKLAEHRGTITDATYPVRIVDNKILTRKGASRIEAMLRTARVPFQRYDDVSVEDPASASPQTDLSERRPNLLYNPQGLVIG